jgi:tRNA threonylcarbamoyladenosine biosynthesis protein TsaE
MSLPVLIRNAPDVQIFLPDEASATRFAQICADHLGAGDTVLLSGPVGAGKSHFARAVIRAHLGQHTEVPSPSFTLVQCYEAEFEIWHADLYRLTHSYEVAELGLEDAMGKALCLIEWPDRLAQIPPHAISLSLSMAGEGRIAHLCGACPALISALKSAFSV